MDSTFWHDRWQRREIGFHRDQINALLQQYFPRLDLRAGQRVFVPLCGKTKDISYFLQQGFDVVGVELSEVAIQELFAELDLPADVIEIDGVRCYRSPQLRVFAGDFFRLNATQLGQIDAIYDRAALVALPLSMRQDYSKHLVDICRAAPQLLITYEYDQSLVDGPPFSISAQEVHQHYGARYAISALTTVQVEGGMKGKASSTETVYYLR